MKQGEDGERDAPAQAEIVALTSPVRTNEAEGQEERNERKTEASSEEIKISKIDTAFRAQTPISERLSMPRRAKA